MRGSIKILLLFSDGSVFTGTLDPLAPGAPTIDLVAGSDLGTSSTDNITSDTTPDFTVTFATPPLEDDEVTAYIDDVAQTPHVVTAGEAGGADIQLGLGALTEGVHSIEFTHSRNSHESAKSNAVSITINTTAPAISGAFSPADNATGVAVDADLVVAFSEAIFLGASGTVTLKKTSDDSTVDSWDVSADEGSGAGQLEVLNDDELHLHLTSSLTGGLEVYVVWDAGIVTDEAGNNVAAQASTTAWSFTTVSAERTWVLASSSIVHQTAVGSRAWASASGSINVES